MEVVSGRRRGVLSLTKMRKFRSDPLLLVEDISRWLRLCNGCKATVEIVLLEKNVRRGAEATVINKQVSK